MKYTWVFLETGKVKKTLKFCLCHPGAKGGYIQEHTIKDLNIAWQYEREAIEAGHEFTNNIKDFLEGKRPESKKGVKTMDQPEFNRFLKGPKAK